MYYALLLRQRVNPNIIGISHGLCIDQVQDDLSLVRKPFLLDNRDPCKIIFSVEGELLYFIGKVWSLS